MELKDLNIQERLIIGGSPSTGSSLLRRILNRHSEVFSGEESSLFTKSQLYENWAINKFKIFKSAIFGLRSAGWHHYTGVDLDESTYGWKKTELEILIKESITFSQFADQLFSRKLIEKNKSIWIEKTPSNCFLFEAFHEEFKGKTIHIVRSPLDTIASLVSRGFNVYEAVTRYLLFVSFGAKLEGSPRHLIVRYEDLIGRTDILMDSICKFIGVPMEAGIIDATTLDANTKSRMQGWNFDETAAIESSNTDRFNKLDAKTQGNIIYAIQSIAIKEDFLVKHKLPFKDIIGLFGLLDYDLNLEDKKSIKYNIKSELNKDVFFRTRKMYEDHIFNYPIHIL